jgi:hypothetical protein
MRLAFASSCLTVILGAGIAFGQQPPGTGSHRSQMTQGENGKARREYRPEYAQNKIEVINGEATKTVVFDEANLARSSSEKAPPQDIRKRRALSTAVAPSPFRVEVVNGMSSETQYFDWDPERQQRLGGGGEHARPVVVGIESSNTRIMGGNKHPLVIGIESNGAGDAAAQKSATKLEYRLVPQPKRPPYWPFESQ